MTKRQLDPGTYRVKQAGSYVGWVYATGTAGSFVTEHWVLFDGFVSPTSSTSMDVIEASTSYTSLTTFMSDMQVEINNQGLDGTYVKASCDYSSLPVTS